MKLSEEMHGLTWTIKKSIAEPILSIQNYIVIKPFGDTNLR